MAILALTTPGEDVDVGGTVSVIGTVTGGEVITITRGSISLDASFNTGGDTIVLPGYASSYAVQLVGSRAVIASSDVSVSIPIGIAGTSIQFENTTLSLVIDTTSGTPLLGDQTIVATPQPVGEGPPQTAYGTNLFYETEPNGDVTAANAVDRELLASSPDDPNVTNADFASVVIRGQIENNNDIDAFSIFLNAGETLILDVDGAYDPDDVSGLDSIIGIWDSGGQVVTDNDDGDMIDQGSASEFDSYLTFEAPVSGTYYFGIISFDYGTEGGAPEDYHLIVSVEDAMQTLQHSTAMHAEGAFVSMMPPLPGETFA